MPSASTINEDIYIVSAVRTPIATFRGSFKSLTSVDLGVFAAKEAISRAGIKPEQVEETIAGSVLTAGCGQNVARQISIKSGVPDTVNAYTVNKVCSSSLKALVLATQSHQLGYREISLIVGTESMSSTPFYLNGDEHSFGDIKLVLHSLNQNCCSFSTAITNCCNTVFSSMKLMNKCSNNSCPRHSNWMSK
jgi:acetyl-CoA C-acetyltransferase